MVQLSLITKFLDEFAPAELAEEWDNVGLLIGDASRDVARVMTCLTLTPDVAAEAIEGEVQLIVAHHPILFRPVQRLTAEDAQGRMLLGLIAAGVSIFSPHTGYDSAEEGINQQLAELFELDAVGVLRPKSPEETSSGAGRFGTLRQPLQLGDLLALTKEKLQLEQLQFVGDENATIERLGIACGSAAEFLPDTLQHGCQALLTGEARFHACLEARELGVALILPGHYATERPAMERLATEIGDHFPQLSVWASAVERDPVQWA